MAVDFDLPKGHQPGGAVDVCGVTNHLHLTHSDPDEKCTEVSDRLFFLSCGTGSGF